MRKQKLHVLLGTLSGLLLIGLIAFLPHKAIAANPATINFQGKIVNSNGTNITDGTYSVVFRIYNTSSPTMTTSCTSTASCLWQETQGSVTVTSGVFQVELGSSCSLTSGSCNNSAGGPINYANNSSLYLTMQFNGDTSGSNGGFMSPLIHMNSVPFALYSDNSGALGGLSAGNFVQLAQGLQTDSSTTNASIAINKTGSTANILQLQKSGADVMKVDNGGLITLQPAAGLTSGQNAISQTLTNSSSTGGIVTGLNQLITISNTSSASITQGIKIAITDAGSLANTDYGINVDLSGISNIAATRTAAKFTGGSVLQATNGGTYISGVDVSTGTGAKTYNQAASSGNYLYVVSAGNSTNCNTAGNSIGCELQIYDISNPTSPSYVGGADVTGSTNAGTGAESFNSISIAGKYAYIVKSGNDTLCSQSAGSAIGCELQVYDISKPSAPVYIGGADATGSSNSGTGDGTAAHSDFKSITVSGRYGFIAKSSSDTTACSGTAGSALRCELQVYDLGNPSSPTYIGGADASGSTNSGTANDTFNWVYASRRYVYIAKAASATDCLNVAKVGCELQIYDISTPSSPTFVGGADASGADSNQSGGSSSAFNSVFVAGAYAYIAKAADGTNCNGTNKVGCELQIYNISNPSVPSIVSGVDTSGSTNNGAGNGGAFNQVFVTGRYAFVSKAGSGNTCSAITGSANGCELQIYDVADPSNPQFVGGDDTSGSLNSGGGNSAQNYALVIGNYAYIEKIGDSTACSQLPGSAVGCELQIYNITGADLTSLTSGNIYAGTLSVGTNSQVLGDFNVQGSASIGQSLSIGNGLSVQNAAGISMLNIDSSTSTITFGSATNGLVLTASTYEPVLNGTARHARIITLVPEYPGAVMTGDGSSNTGTMTSDFCSGSSLRNIPSASNPCGASEEHNYYTWVTTAQNNYDIWVRWQVPSDFSDFAASNPITMYGWRTDSTATTTVTLSLYNASGALCGSSTNVATGTAAWTSTPLGGTITAAACSISAGNVVDFRVQMAANNKTVRAGELTINYLSKY